MRRKSLSGRDRPAPVIMMEPAHPEAVELDTRFDCGVWPRKNSSNNQKCAWHTYVWEDDLMVPCLAEHGQIWGPYRTRTGDKSA